MLKNLYLFVGQSGSGKTTITERLQELYGYQPLVSYTTRPPRYPEESSHIFVSPEEFDQLGEMVAYTEFNGHRYGTTAKVLEQADMYVIDPAGIYYLWDHYKGKRPMFVIGILADQEEIRNRMRARGDSEEAIASRLENDAKMFADMQDVCHVMFENKDLDTTVAAIKQCINYAETGGAEF